MATDIEPGTAVRWRHQADVLIEGVVESIVGNEATVVELDATHALWGHSGNCAGTRHEVPLDKLLPIKLKRYQEERWKLLKEQGRWRRQEQIESD